MALTGMAALDQRHDRGEVLILDGATGTEVERRGFPIHGIAWSGGVMFEKPDLVRHIHEDYIRAGADVITAKSYSCCRHVLEPAGFGDRVETANRLAIRLAREARERAADGRPVAIAGSISMFVADDADPYLKQRSDQRNWRTPESLYACYREQARLLADEGADLLILEMFQIPEWSTPAIDAALETGVPVWLGMSCGPQDEQGNVRMCSWPDRRFEETITLIRPELAAVCVMHSEVRDVRAGLALVRSRWNGPLGAYAHSGGHVHPKWFFDNVISPADYAKAVAGWCSEFGVSLIGGCCGTRPDHISALRAMA